MAGYFSFLLSAFSFSRQTSHSASGRTKLLVFMGDYYSKAIGQLHAKRTAILLDGVLNMEMRGGIGIPTIQNIVNAGRELEVLNQILAEKCEIKDAVTSGIAALDGDGLAEGIGRVAE